MKGFTSLQKQHQNEIVSYLKFIRLQRIQTIKELHLTFKEITERRLVEDTYNEQDVQSIIDELEATSKSTMEDELVQHSHMNVVLLLQYLDQAERRDLVLNANMPKLEDRDLLAMAAKIEKDHFSANANGQTAQENVKSASQDSISLQPESVHRAIETSSISKELERNLRDRIDDLEEELRQLKLKTLVPPLPAKDLEVRLDRSTPVQNLKKMLASKNDMLREYRSRLARYDPSILDDEDD
ncbi:Leucine zipper transcription factor-like protein 1 [Chytridiales sp. JEL 0842]|nr:Leucine zipper transcription factor-like protein 1 [Chytridiales sp. JEL 0842]